MTTLFQMFVQTIPADAGVVGVHAEEALPG